MILIIGMAANGDKERMLSGRSLKSFSAKFANKSDHFSVPQVLGHLQVLEANALSVKRQQHGLCDQTASNSYGAGTGALLELAQETGSSSSTSTGVSSEAAAENAAALAAANEERKRLADH